MSWGTRTGVTQANFKDVQDIRLVRWVSDYSAFEGPEAAAQTFKAGQPIKLVNGAVTACVTNDTVGFGLAVKDATGITGIPMPSIPFNEDIVFIVKCIGGSVALANVGTNFNLDLTAGLYTLNLASSAQPFFKIVALPVGFATVGSENNNRAYVIGANAARQMN